MRIDVVPDVPVGTSGTVNKTPSQKDFIVPKPDKFTKAIKNDVVLDVPNGTSRTTLSSYYIRNNLFVGFGNAIRLAEEEYLQRRGSICSS